MFSSRHHNREADLRVCRCDLPLLVGECIDDGGFVSLFANIVDDVNIPLHQIICKCVTTAAHDQADEPAHVCSLVAKRRRPDGWLRLRLASFLRVVINQDVSLVGSIATNGANGGVLQNLDNLLVAHQLVGKDDTGVDKHFGLSSEACQCQGGRIVQLRCHFFDGLVRCDAWSELDCDHEYCFGEL